MPSFKDIRREFSDTVVSAIKIRVAVSVPPHQNIAIACTGLYSSSAVLLGVEDGWAVALAILCACSEKDKQLGRSVEPDVESAISFLGKAVRSKS